jgi:hypothetical protein
MALKGFDMYKYTVTNETNETNDTNVPPEEMGTNHPLSMIRGLSPVALSLFRFV